MWWRCYRTSERHGKLKILVPSSRRPTKAQGLPLRYHVQSVSRAVYKVQKQEEPTAMNCARMLPIELVLNFQRIMAIRSFSTSSIHSAKSQPGYFVPLPEGQTLPDLKDDKRIPGKKLKLRRSGFVKYKKGLAVVSPKANLQTGGRLPALQPEAKSESAQRIFLPNINLYLVRNGPQHANDPFTATFRCPITLTKPDIVQYLRQVYGVQLSGIRTAVYRSTPRQLRIRAYSGRRTMGSQQKTYKKVRYFEFKLLLLSTHQRVFKYQAVVQLKDPFLYPPEPNREFLNEHWSL